MSNPRILIVDDDSNVRRVLQKTFERAGFLVAVASNGEVAISLLFDHEYAAMISDITMPKMDGKQLCRHLASQGPYLPDCTFIVTSRSEAEQRSWVSEFPGVSIVEKPVGPRQLVKLVKERLSVSRSRESSLAGVEIP